MEAKSSADMRVNRVKEQLDASLNLILSDPTQYDSVLGTVDGMIDSMGLNGDSAADLKRGFKQDAARNHFVGRYDAAKDIETVDQIEKELRDNEAWRGSLSREQYDALLDKARVRRDQIRTLNTADAKANVEYLEDLVKSGMRVSPSFVSEVIDVAEKSGDRSFVARAVAAGEVSKVQEEYKGATSTAVRAAITDLEVNTRGLNQDASKGIVTDVEGNRLPANFTALDPDVQYNTHLLAAAFGKPIRVTPHGGKNKRASGTSQHPLGRATDILVSDYDDHDKMKLIALAVALGAKGIGGYAPDSGSDGAGTIHIDWRRNPSKKGPGGVANWWRTKNGDVSLDAAPKWFQEGIYRGLQGRKANMIPNTSPTGLAARDLPPEAVSFLLTVSGVESSHRYNVIFGGERFSSFDDHPRVFKDAPGGVRTSAAGRYQNIATTWDEVAGELGLSDFSPENQDIGNWHLAQKRYKSVTGSDLTSDIRAGEYGKIRKALAPTWEALGGMSDEEFQAQMEGSYAAGGRGSARYGALTDMLERQQKGLESDPVNFANHEGIIEGGPVDFNNPASFSRRAQDFSRIQEYYSDAGVTIDKVLTDDEIVQIKEIFDEGSVDQQATALASLNQLGNHTDEALNQIGQENPEMAYLGSMAAEGAMPLTREALRGLKIQQDAGKQAEALLDTGFKGGTTRVFNEYTGQSLLALGDAGPAAQSVADALYLSRRSRKPGLDFDEEMYHKAIEDALGGEVYEHNDVTMVLPAGVTGDDFEDFLSNLAPEDLISLSASGQPPVFAEDMSPVPPEWFEDEARFVTAGRGSYYFVNELGDQLADASGNPYVMLLSREKIAEIKDAVRTAPIEQQPDRPEENVPQPPSGPPPHTEPQVSPDDILNETIKRSNQREGNKKAPPPAPTPHTDPMVSPDDILNETTEIINGPTL